MSNYLSTLGSDVNVLLLCPVAMEINGHSYSAGEPFTYLKGVTASIDSQIATPQASTLSPSNRGLHLLDATQYLDQLILNNVPYSKKVQGLFFQSTGSYPNVEWTRVNAVQTKLRVGATSIFLYKDGVFSADYAVTGDWLTITNFDAAATYMLNYLYPDNGFAAFKSENYPYFKAVLYIKGNVANKTSDQTIVFEKLALVPQTALNFLPNAQNFVTLNFGIIDADKTVRLKI